MSVEPKKELLNIPELKIEEIKKINNSNNIDNNIKTINNINTIPKTCLYTRKMNEEEKNKGEITKLIYNSFHDPDYYFSENSPIKVNSKINLKKIDIFAPNEGRKFSHLRIAQRKENINASKVSNTETNKSLSLGIQKQNNIKTINTNKKYEFIDNGALKNIFEDYKLKNKENRKLRNNEMSFSRSINNNLNKSRNSHSINIQKNNSNFNNNFPLDLFDSLNYQYRQINEKQKRDKKVISLSKYISQKINKDEKDLLFNKVDLFKYKKEILKEIYDEKPQEQKFGKFQWNMDLRKPHNYIGLKKLYVNVNSERNPFWGVIVERCPDLKETAVKPGYNLDQKEFLKFTKNKNILKNKKCVNSVKNLDDLNVNGSNLLDLEYKREMSSKGRKILHKVFIENGNIILDKDINNIFGEETIYKNYENANTINYNNKKEYPQNEYEGENVHYKFNQKGKKSRIVSSISRSLEKSGSISNLFNNAQTLKNDF